MAAFKLDLPATVAFDYPTALSLAGFVVSALAASDTSSAGSDGLLHRGSQHQAPATSRHRGMRLLMGQNVSAAPPAATSEAIQLKVAGVATEVLGKELPVQQPLMEVCKVEGANRMPAIHSLKPWMLLRRRGWTHSVPWSCAMRWQLCSGLRCPRP